MKFSSLFLFALPFAALADTVAYDETYDNASTSLDVVACSDGVNGLESKGFTTFGSLPKFPLIGAAGAVAGFNSPNCGTCWQLTYTNGSGVKKSINIIAVDHAGPGTFNIALAAMNTLTGGQAVELGRVNVVSTQVAASACGL
ncbi:cerato-platanin-related secreted protein [Mycena filopes]|nr:cerato-platanin-related secreted protein [Mycena filopes]